ncbi:nitrate reductase molybdenum cofactor assembly chaperone [Paenibacillus sp. N3/727]|uniref:nitrate reductase molybdenum cofactor assembly chaperone n=1 Tax=Paenibacillus sp. N3/727 TaxID=2925845 RepID=UPI001F52EB0F|nr:nitrate reductase molybdenum cofactor assembly chaperone [Paenibacillus sp. N3/727]UNK16248.1 nitrate reductase molybdenum cofactor assembly chaperone [Paenibacillus sp. N3/727]
MNELVQRSSWMMMSCLLQYPDEKWHETADEMYVSWCELLQQDSAEMNEQLIQLAGMCIAGFTGMDSEAVTAQYVKTFDFSKKTNLYLTYGQLGEERARGPALLKLKQIYEEENMLLATEELPDYLPLVLEYAAVAEDDKGASLLYSFKEALEGTREALVALDSPYQHVLQALMLLLEQSEMTEGSFHFEPPAGCTSTGEITGCGPMWAAAGYGGTPTYQKVDPDSMRRRATP